MGVSKESISKFLEKCQISNSGGPWSPCPLSDGHVCRFKEKLVRPTRSLYFGWHIAVLRITFVLIQVKKSDFRQSFLGYSCNCNIARTFIIARLEPTTGSVHVISRRVGFIPSSQHTCNSRRHLSVFVILCQKAIVTYTCCRSNGFYSR